MAQRLNRMGGPLAGPAPAGVSVEDALLIERVRDGQTEAFGDLVRKYQDRVFNTCWRLCGNLEDARDLTQDAFLKAFEQLTSFRYESGFYTWLFRVAVNLALTHRRKSARRKMISLDAESGNPDQAGPLVQRTRVAADAAPSAGEALDEAEVHARLARELQRLDDDHRAIVVLRDIEGFDYQEIAAILNVPTGTVKSRLFRARTALKEALSPPQGTA